MVRLEHFRNMGRATPAAAVQTVIWAAANADFDEVGKTMMLSEAGRVKAQTLLDQQLAETRARFSVSSPEKLVGVLFRHDFTTRMAFSWSTLRPTGLKVRSCVFAGSSTVSCRAASGRFLNPALEEIDRSLNRRLKPAKKPQASMDESA